MNLNTSQQSEFDHQSFCNAVSRINDDATDRSNLIMGPQLNGDPLVLVPLSIVRSLMKTNNFPHETNRVFKVQQNGYPHANIKGNISNNVIEAPEEVQDVLHQTIEIDCAIASPDTNLTQTQRKYDSMKNAQQKPTASKVTKQHKIGRIKSKLGQPRKIKSLKSIRSVSVVKAPGNLKSSETSTALLCKVCGDKESAHVHYGGNSCKSCRQFFRRTIEKSTRYLETNVLYITIFHIPNTNVFKI